MASRTRGRDEGSLLTDEESAKPIDDQVRELIEKRAAELENRIQELESELDALDNFARITLKERRIAENNANLAKVSDTLSGFAENTTDKLNTLKSNQERNTLLLAAVVEALDDADEVDVDLSEVRDHREGRPVTGISPDDRLDDALD